MNTRKWSKTILLFALFTLTLIGLPQFAFCTGGSGGDGGGGGGEDSNLASYQGAATTLLSELSFDEIKGLMHGLNADVRSMLLDDYSTWPPGTTVKQLIDLIDTGVPVSKLNEKERDSLLANLDQRTREYLLQDFALWTKDLDVDELRDVIKKSSDMTSRDAAAAEAAYHLVDYVNEGGKKFQTVLGYIPYVSLFTSVTLDVTREWAEGRIEEQDSGDTDKNTTVKFTSSLTTNSLSQADKIFGYAAKSKKAKALQWVLFLGNKYIESKVGNSLEKTTRLTGKAVDKHAAPLLYGTPIRQNKVTKPTYASSTGHGPGQAQHTNQ
jgi:hypothetical protein